MAIRWSIFSRSGRVAVAALAWLALAGQGEASSWVGVPGRAPLRVELRPDVQVRGRQVLLGEVATLTTLDRGLLERLMTLPLGPAPRTGTSVRVERAPLVRWIRARTGLRPEQVTWVGPAFTTVRAAVDRVSGEAIARCAAEALAGTAAEHDLKLEPGQPATPRDQDVPAGEVELRARRIPRAALHARRASVWVDLWVDGRFARTVPVTFELGEAGPAEWRSEPLPRLARAEVPEPPAVRRGATVRLRSVEGAISLERQVVALEDGRAGQLVRVRAPHAEAPVLARVMGPGAVEVQP